MMLVGPALRQGHIEGGQDGLGPEVMARPIGDGFNASSSMARSGSPPASART